MPWNARTYPTAMKHLPDAVRAKAIEIANALLAEGYSEGQAIRMAIAAARSWARNHPDEAAELQGTPAPRPGR